MMVDSCITLSARIRASEYLDLTGEPRQKLNNFLPRLGMIVTVSDAAGDSFRARITALDAETARLFVFEAMSGPAESRLSIILLQALPDKERMELIIQKSVELGVDVIVPFHSQRSISLAEREARQPKAHKWQTHALRAARQCRRGRVPLVAEYTDLDGAAAWAEGTDLRLVLWEAGQGLHLKNILTEHSAARSAAVMIGPEGGWDPAEIERLIAYDFIPVTLGRRILRTETAAITAVALLQYELGDLR